MKGNKNTVSCCLHSTELVWPAHLDILRLPSSPGSHLPFAITKDITDLGGLCRAGCSWGQHQHWVCQPPSAAPNSHHLRTAQLIPDHSINTYHSCKINGHQWVASQEEVI